MDIHAFQVNLYSPSQDSLLVFLHNKSPGSARAFFISFFMTVQIYCGKPSRSYPVSENFDFFVYKQLKKD